MHESRTIMTIAGSNDAPHTPNGWFAEALSAVRDLAAEARELREASEEPLTDALAQLLTAEYVLATKADIRQAGGGLLDAGTLRMLCRDVTALRRGDQAAERLRLDRERFEEELRKRRKEEEKAGRQARRPRGLRKGTIRKIERELRLL